MQSDDPMLVANKRHDQPKYEIQIANPKFEKLFESIEGFNKED